MSDRDERSPSQKSHRLSAWAQLPAPDPLMDDLRERIRRYSDEELGKRGADEAATVRGAQGHEWIFEDENSLLAETNAAITALRAARIAGEQGKEAAPKHSLPAAALLATGLLVCLSPSAIIWQLWPPLATRFGGFPTLLIDAAVVAACIGLAYALFWGTSKVLRQQEENPRFGEFGAIAGALGTELVGAGLAVWRLWEPSHAALGFLAWVVWFTCTIPALFIIIRTLISLYEAWYEDCRASPYQYHPLRGTTVRAIALLFVAMAVAILGGEVAGAQLTLSESGHIGLLAVIILFTLWAAPGTIWIGRMLIHRSKRDRRRLHVQEAERSWDHEIRPSINDLINRRLSEKRRIDSTSFNVPTTDGILQLNNNKFVVETSTAFTAFERLLEHVGGGAIGVAGQRGTGKTTLLEVYRDGRFLAAGREHLAILETVPVKYEARDFALHIYAPLCKGTVTFVDRKLGVRDSWLKRWLRFVWQTFPTVLILTSWLAIGYLGAGALLRNGQGLQQWIEAIWWPLVILGLTVIVMIAPLRRRLADAVYRNPSVTDLRGLRSLSISKLADIHFQQRHTEGWSGKLALPFGGDLGRTRSREVSRQAMTYPEIIADFREFVSTTVRVLRTLEDTIAAVPVAILIDEVDKILEPAQAQDFINEAKALFGVDVPGCIFMVSVAQEALGSYERSGAPFRDTFEGAFDSIFRLGHLTLADTRDVLRARVPGMSEQFVSLCHCLSGGLPRQVVRTVRDLFTVRQLTLAHATVELVRRGIEERIGTVRDIVSTGTLPEPLAVELLEHLTAFGVPSREKLVPSLQDPPVKESRVGNSEGLAKLLKIQTEALGYFYFYLSILEIFNDELRGDQNEEVFERLAMARRDFAVNPRMAWSSVTSARRRKGLEVWRLPLGEALSPGRVNGRQQPRRISFTQSQ